LDCGIAAASEAVTCALALRSGERVQKPVRVRSTAEGPLSHITSYVPESLAPSIGPRDLARKPLLSLLEEAGVGLGEASQVISARPAESIAAEHLQLAMGSALLVVPAVSDSVDSPGA
jgi:GntR family transcriptional regulator